MYLFPLAFLVPTANAATIAVVLAGCALVVAAVRLQLCRRQLEKVLAQKTKELEETRKREEQSSKDREEFLANVSHEIRTPMNGILGMTQLALSTSLDGEQLEYLQRTKESAEALLKILNDLLDISKLDGRRFEMQNQPFDLRECLVTTVRAAEPAARAKSLELVHHVNDDVPEIVLGDPDRVRQVLSNLLDNAVKFTTRGDITVQVSATGSAGAFTFVEFSVSDTGVGIPPASVESIFEPFGHRGVEARVTGGTGLGLPLAKRLVQLMGGTLNVSSKLGQGSRFYFALPLQRGKIAQPKPPQNVPPPENPLRVLLAEDNPVNQQVALRMLERHGHKVEIATTGLEALAMLDRGSYDVVLMDVHMPEMDGLTATRLLREREGKSRRSTPVLAMTANAMGGDREKCLEAGMNDYVSKPIQADHFLNTIYTLVHDNAATRA